MGDTLRIQNGQPNTEADTIRDPEEHPVRVVDKDARPAGRRFHAFTPPEVGVAPETQPVKLPWWAPFAARRKALVAILFAAVAGTIVSLLMKIHVMEQQIDAAGSPLVAAASASDSAAGAAAPASASAPAASIPQQVAYPTDAATRAPSTARTSAPLATAPPKSTRTTTEPAASKTPEPATSAKPSSEPAGLAPPDPTF